MSDYRIICKIVFWIFWTKNVFWKTINFGRNRVFVEKGLIWSLLQLASTLKPIAYESLNFNASFKKNFVLGFSRYQPVLTLWKFSFFLKKKFFQFFHRINILDFFRPLLGPCEVKSGQLRPWRLQVVMSMTSFPNYYVITDLCDRTSFLGQMDWNSVWNGILA